MKTTHYPIHPKAGFDPGIHYLEPGYEQRALFSDVVQVFDNTPKIKKLRDVATQWHAEALTKGKVATSRTEAARWHKVLRRLRRSKLRDVLLKSSNNDPVRAAKTYLNLLNQQYGSTGNAAGKRAEKLAEKAGKLDISIPGGASSEIIYRAMNLSAIIDKIKIKYQSLEARRVGRGEESLWPEEIEVESLRSYRSSDVARLTTNEWMKEDEEFDVGIATKQLRQHTYYEPKPEPPKKLVMLMDVSGSMSEAVPGQYEFSRSEFACASAIALLRSGLKGGHNIELRFFDGQPHEPIKGTAHEIEQYLIQAPFSGGGTSINRALSKVDEQSPDEIIIITDGGDSPNYRPKSKLTSYICGEPESHAAEHLRRVSRYFEVVSLT